MLQNRIKTAFASCQQCQDIRLKRRRMAASDANMASENMVAVAATPAKQAMPGGFWFEYFIFLIKFAPECGKA